MLKFIKKYFLSKYTYKIWLFIFFDICVITIDIFITYSSGTFIDKVVSKVEISTLIHSCIVIISLYIVSILSSFGYQVLSAKLREDISFKVSSDVVDHMQHIPILEIKKYDPSYLTQRIYSDSSDLVNFTLDNVISMVVNFFVMLFLIYYIMNTNLKIFVAFICFVPLYITIYIFSKQKLIEKMEGVKENQNIYYQRLYEQVRLIENIKTDSAFEESKSFLFSAYHKYINIFMSYTKCNSWVKSIESIVSYLFYALLLLYGAIEMTRGNLTIGEFTIINAYFNKSLGVIRYYLELGKSWNQVDIANRRIKELMDIKVEFNGSDEIIKISSIMIKNLSFCYPGTNKYILQNMNLEFCKGKIYIIKGKNGKGKSTFLNCVLGLLPTANNIQYNSIGIEHLDMYTLRKEKIAVLRQKIEFPFDELGKVIDIPNSSIRETNIFKELFFNKTFNITQLCSSYPDKLSGGELQKMYLYKTLKKNSDVLILDEPTSALDNHGTSLVYDLLKQEKKNKIIIVVSHNKEFENIGDEIIQF